MSGAVIRFGGTKTPGTNARGKGDRMVTGHRILPGVGDRKPTRVRRGRAKHQTTDSTSELASIPAPAIHASKAIRASTHPTNFDARASDDARHARDRSTLSMMRSTSVGFSARNVTSPKVVR